MHSAPVLTLYIVSFASDLDEDRWRDCVLPVLFYEDREEARRSMFALRDEFASDPYMIFPVCLEKVETIPMTKSAIVELLNNGPEKVIGSCDVIEQVDRP